MNIFGDALDIHFDLLASEASEQIEYEQHGVGVINTAPEGGPLMATIGASRFEALDQLNNIIEIKSKDFILPQSHLVLGGTLLTPKRNDLIRQTINDVVLVFRVLPDPGIPHYRETDGLGKGWRIFTKQINN